MILEHFYTKKWNFIKNRHFVIKFYLIALIFPILCNAYTAQTSIATPKHSRHAILRGKVNWRSGPGSDHEISWCYESPGWPVIILKKYDNWYYIQDFLGTRGWVKGSMLCFKTNVLVCQTTFMYVKPNDKARKKAKLMKGSILRYIKSDSSAWVYVLSPDKGLKGWVSSSCVWPNILPVVHP